MDAGLVALIILLVLIGLAIDGCIRECRQAGKYDGR